MTGSAKIGHNRIFFLNSCLLNIYNLRSQVYPLAKFQLHMPITLGVTALQSCNNRKIDLYTIRVFSLREQAYVIYRNRHIGAHVAMVQCVVFGCNNRSDSESDKGISFYRIPAVTDREEKADYELRKLRRDGYLAAINRKNLDLQRLDKYRICERHFISGIISGSPASLYDRTSPDWLPTLNLGYEASDSCSSMKDRVKRYERAHERELRKTVQQETE